MYALIFGFAPNAAGEFPGRAMLLFTSCYVMEIHEHENENANNDYDRCSRGIALLS